MAVIQRMSEHLANKIAAGEVIERPASVVKELVENAIDAQATAIEIILEQAGTQLIQVSDNGSGMSHDDALRAFERHATSKLHDEYELFQIQTLGFRGEALPSIASVAKVTLQTSTGTESSKVVIHGGKLQLHEQAAAKKGTLIQVEQLFYNTPARLKYLKTTTTEVNHVLDYVTKTALAQPGLRIRLQHNGKILFQSPGNGDLRQVLALVYSLPIAKSAVVFAAETPDVKVEGYAALPEHQKTNRNAMTIAINGRVIKNYAIQRAIIEAYYTMIPDSRFPVVVLNIMMDPRLLDVNVHPAKLEVRLSQEAQLQQLVKATIRESLQQQALIPTIEPKVKSAQTQPIQSQFWQSQQPTRTQVQQAIQAYTPPTLEHGENDSAQIMQASVPVSSKQVLEPTLEQVGDEQNARGVSGGSCLSEQRGAENLSGPNFDYCQTFPPTGATQILQIKQEPFQSLEEMLATPQDEVVKQFPTMQVIGQLFGTYILAQGEAMFYLIDQHAAQERIKYEQFMQALREKTIQTQTLLLPFTFEVSAPDFQFVSDNLAKLAQVGVLAEPFGMQSFIVRALPTFIPKDQEIGYIEAMFELILQQRKIDVVHLQEEAAIMQSCKKSIKANHALTLVEMQTLIQQLAECQQPYNCPHGRPVVVQHRQYEIEKWFKRIM
ncbi:MAG: DNA mismatch repair endonuclease MutL [Culicoidibacterales bacterium]